MKKKMPSLKELQDDAIEYAKKYLSTHKMVFGDLSDEDFAKTMDAAMQAIVFAYGEGYTKGSGR